MKNSVLLVAALALMGGAISASAITPAEVRVKKAIADKMTAEELAAYKVRLAERVNRGEFENPLSATPRTPADLCTAATPEISTLPYASGADTTVGQADNYDLPADTTPPTCTVGATCAGAPDNQGDIYTGTGQGPDKAYMIQTDANCSLTITMNPTGGADLGLIVYQANCTSSLADCACVDDTGIDGASESVTLSAVAGTVYYVVTDGYLGSSSAFDIAITGSGCALTPVSLQSFSVGN